ncbi:ABC transporter ATP-binding protein [Glycomyces rhizosphaerae]|uniref:ABC transporter ATP-binding protein n=1 Tax=Glycomyces rhizosphaerae TaxID=2054422 RepID=A0ABV7Q206_9ACTN
MSGRRANKSGTGLDAHLVVERGAGEPGGFRLDLPLRVAPGETVALLGPNGAGKTTALRALAGLEALSGGQIILNGEILDRPKASAGRSRAARSGSQIDGPQPRRSLRAVNWHRNNPDTAVRHTRPEEFEQRDSERVPPLEQHGARWVPPEDRRIGVVFQDYLLFPHLSAIDNVAFGPRRRGSGRAEARALAADWLDRVGLGDFGKRRPRQLSGGQAQRVALARALATDPALLLLDEPLAALDARTRLDTRAELHRHLTGHTGPAIVVTHDPVDALMLADRLIVVEDGRAVQEGDAESVTARPRTDYIARLVGLNLYRGRAEGHRVLLDRTADGSASVTRFDAGDEPAESPEDAVALVVSDPLEGPAFAAFPPSAVALYPSRPEGSPRNTWRATVSGVHRHGDNLRVQLDGPLKAAADVTPAAAAQLGLEPGQTVWAAVKATEITAYPA